MENERKIFECRVAGRDLELEYGNCVAVLFRNYVEVDYLAVHTTENALDEETQMISPEDVIIRIFNNPSLVRWMAGYRLAWAGDNLDRPQVLNFQDTPDSFRELTGWNPPVIEKEEPTDEEMEWFLDVNAGNIDAEWRALG